MKELILPVTVGGLTFKNPFYVASGPTTKNVRQLQRIEETGWAAASIKLTIAPVPYLSRKPRYGMFTDRNSLAFTTEKRLDFEEGLRLVEDGKKVLKDLLLFANITYAGDEGLAGWVDMAKRFEAAGADVIELNMCCPNMSYNLQLTTGDAQSSAKKTGASLGQDGDAVADIVTAIKKEVSIPVFVKITPEGGHIAQVSKRLVDAGADAVGGNGNRMAIPTIDLENPGASTFHFQDEISMACHCGPWLTPLAQRDTYEIRKACGPDARIMATGGVAKWEDAVSMIMCGADLVGVCAETLISGYDIVRPMVEGVSSYLDSHGYESLRTMRDVIVPQVKTAADVTQYAGYAKIVDSELAAPCKSACPLHIPAQAYIQSIAKGDFRAAYDLITSKGPLQAVCGYVCNHPCEEVCTRGISGQPLRIKDLKRFVMDYGTEQKWKPTVKMAEKRPQRVAVVGSGPSGLSCAYALAQAGYTVSVFEREKELGGALRLFIPSFRLPREVLGEQVKLVKGMGVQFHTGMEYGKDFTLDSLKADGYEAVFLGIGAQKSRPLGIPGEPDWTGRESGGNAKVLGQGSIGFGMVPALDFLRDTGRKGEPGVVVVVGGGFTAIDSARAALRMGAKRVYVAYRRTKEEMPAGQEEVAEAEAEGVSFLYLAAPTSVVSTDGRITGLEMCVQTLGGEDESLRRRPEEVCGARFVLACDTIIPAVGQSPEQTEVQTGKGGIQVDPVTLQTSREAVYAGGDAVNVDSVISSVAAGKRAAVSIDRLLSGNNAVLEYEPEPNQVDPREVLARAGVFFDEPAPAAHRRDPDALAGDFDLHEEKLTEEEAVREAARCLNCGCGEGCQICKTICCDFAPLVSGSDRIEINKDDCVACGMCFNLCPNHNIEMVRDDGHL